MAQFNQKRKSSLRWVFPLNRTVFLVCIFQIWGKESKKSIKTKIYHYVPRWIDFAPKNNKISKIPNFSNKPQIFFLSQFLNIIVITWKKFEKNSATQKIITWDFPFFHFCPLFRLWYFNLLKIGLNEIQNLSRCVRMLEIH